MESMKCPRLVIILWSVALLCSCSWTKSIWAHFHRAPKKAQASSVNTIQPSLAQQEEAQKLLSSLQAADENAPSAAADGATIPRPLDVAQPNGAAPLSAPQLNLTDNPSNTGLPAASAASYPNRLFVPRGTPTYTAPQGETPATTIPEPDAAQIRGLRNPALPNTLPMGIDGKVHSPST